MLEIRCKKAEVWKGSSLALAIHGLKQNGERTGLVNKTSHIEHVAEGMRVRLEQTDGEDWRLLRVK
jgi:hypothetical protein